MTEDLAQMEKPEEEHEEGGGQQEVGEQLESQLELFRTNPWHLMVLLSNN